MRKKVKKLGSEGLDTGYQMCVIRRRIDGLDTRRSENRKSGIGNRESRIEIGAEGDKKGLVLVAVLWVVAVLMIIAAAAGQTSRLDTKVCRGVRTEQLRCKWSCRAGIETAIGVLNEDKDLGTSDSLTDLWSDNEEDLSNIKLEQCWSDVMVVDEASKLNVNTATKEQLLGLWYMTEEIAEAIIDWRDKDDNQSTGGVEGGYYENLPFRYTIRNGPFKTIRELLLVKDVTPELLYGEDTNFNGQLDYNERDGDKSPPADDGDDELDEGWIAHLTCYSYDTNKDASGNKRINIKQANERQLERSLNIKKSHAKWIVEQRKNIKSIADLIDKNSPKKPQKGSEKDSDTAEPLDLQTFYQIADKITVDNSEKIPGKVNINTASEDVLRALLGGDEAAEELARDIIIYRAGLIDGMQSIAEVMQAGIMKIDTFKKVANYITTRSDVFTIRCVATADRSGAAGAKLQTEAVVDSSSTPCKILYWYQGANN